MDDSMHLEKFNHNHSLDLQVNASKLSNLKTQDLDHVLILDLEGKVEILEFPVVMIDTRTMEFIDSFHRYQFIFMPFSCLIKCPFLFFSFFPIFVHHGVFSWLQLIFLRNILKFLCTMPYQNFYLTSECFISYPFFPQNYYVYNKITNFTVLVDFSLSINFAEDLQSRLVF